MSLRQKVTRLPIIGPVTRTIYRTAFRRPPRLPFESSAQYWDERYTVGGNSGAGSYGRLAHFKAEVVNDFVAAHAITTVIEFGCGDGAQLELAKYQYYTGIDVSLQAVEGCRTRFQEDSTKQFFHTASPEADSTRADLSMSLDVIYHLVEDETYNIYMRRLVASSKKYICIYSDNDERISPVDHVRHRRFTDWLARHAPAWKQILKVRNRYPEDPIRPNDTSWADFYFFAIV
jgi:SAM-dependent methyltransferase